jgi:hypothetical protein
LGQRRRLILAFNRTQLVAGEQLVIGEWHVVLRPGRGQRYTAHVSRPAGTATVEGATAFYASADMLLDAYGFTRAELLAVIETLHPFDRAIRRAQERLFIEPESAAQSAQERAYP